MQAQQRGSGFRRFAQTPYGRAALPAATILIVFGSYVYISSLLAIPAMLIFGLAVPIWAGLKQPRYLALAGLVIVLIVAPISTAALVQEIRTPIGPVSSGSALPDGNGGSVLSNAEVTPYTGSSTTNFTWQVTIEPQYVPPGNGTPVMISLFVSTCPGATSNATTYCASGFPFYNLSKPLHNLTSATTLFWNFTIGSNGIWDWQMEIWVVNSTTHGLSDILLQGDPTYNGIEGPVVGTWWDTYGQIVPTLYLNDLLLLGLPFYLVLVLYMYFKRRERQRKEAQRRAAGPPPPDTPAPVAGAGSPPSGSSAPSASSAAQEHNCPQCGAVLYTGETSCWKCGAKVDGSSSGTPLPSSPKG